MAFAAQRNTTKYVVTAVLFLCWFGYSFLMHTVFIPNAGKIKEFRGRIGAVSEDGRLLVTIENNELYVFDTDTKRKLFQDHYEKSLHGDVPVEEIAIHEKHIIFSGGEERKAGDERIVWFDAENSERTEWAVGENPLFTNDTTGIVYHTRDDQYQLVSSLMPTVPGTLFAVSDDGAWAGLSTGIYHVPTKERVARAGILSVVSRDGNTGLTITEDIVSLYDLRTRKLVKTYRADQYAQSAYQYGEKDIIFALQNNKTARVDGARTRVSHMVSGDPTQPLAGADVQYLLTEDFGKVYLWDTKKFKRRYVLHGDDIERGRLSQPYFFISNDGIGSRSSLTTMYDVTRAVRAYQLHVFVATVLRIMLLLSVFVSGYSWYSADQNRRECERKKMYFRKEEAAHIKREEEEMREKLAEELAPYDTPRDKVEYLRDRLLNEGTVREPIMALHAALRHIGYSVGIITFHDEATAGRDAFNRAQLSIKEWGFVISYDSGEVSTTPNAVIAIAKTDEGAIVVAGGDFSEDRQEWQRTMDWVERSKKRYGIVRAEFEN